MSAYANADRIVRPDGNSVPLPAITGAAVFHVNDQGAEFIPASIAPEVFDVFLALRHQVFEWDAVLSKQVLGRPIWEAR